MISHQARKGRERRQPPAAFAHGFSQVGPVRKVPHGESGARARRTVLLKWGQAKAKITLHKHVTNEQFSFPRVAMPQGVYLVQNFTRKVFGGAHFGLA